MCGGGGGGAGDLDPFPENHKCYRFLAVKRTFQAVTYLSAKGSLTVWALYAYYSDSQNAALELLV